MRILIANDGCGDAGGVQTYLEAVAPALGARHHDVRLLYVDAIPSTPRNSPLSQFVESTVADSGLEQTVAAVRRWRPDVVYVHNMAPLELDERLVAIAPVVKFMHGYFGTCIGGLKMHALPTRTPCDRAYGVACSALFFPRRCGQLSARAFLRQRRWAERQRALFPRYTTVMVASEHMRREYIRNGVASSRVVTNPLFAPPVTALAPIPDQPEVVFVGRMTPLKGGDVLIRAVAAAHTRTGQSVRLTMVGDGPQRQEWERLGRQLSVDCSFTGWVDRGAVIRAMRRASVIAVPSIWPEPFGLIGLEAAAVGVPAVAFRVGGVDEWLRDGVNGILADPVGSVDALAEALAAALSDEARLQALRSAAHRTARDMTLDAHVDRLEQTFSPIAARAVAS